MKLRSVEALTSNAQKLRKRSTDAETVLWQYLRGRRFKHTKFRRQQPLGNYIVDFVSWELKLVIELDGSQHLLAATADQQRDAWLQAEGFKVLRFWDNDIFNNIEGVLEHISYTVEHPPLHPLPSREGN